MIVLGKKHHIERSAIINDNPPLPVEDIPAKRKQLFLFEPIRIRVLAQVIATNDLQIKKTGTQHTEPHDRKGEKKRNTAPVFSNFIFTPDQRSPSAISILIRNTLNVI